MQESNKFGERRKRASLFSIARLKKLWVFKREGDARVLLLIIVKYLVIVGILIGLSSILGCAGTAPTAARVQYIERPVPVPCIKKEKLPARPADFDKPYVGGNDAQNLTDILGRAEQTREYSQKLEAELKGCTN